MLRKEGWFCEMNLPCCASCAWSSLPLDIDSDKVLFNHEQDMENVGEECSMCDGNGYIEENFDVDDCEHCYGEGYAVTYFSPEEITDTYFCHSGGDNMKRAIEVFESCGCTVDWELGNDSVRFRVMI